MERKMCENFKSRINRLTDVIIHLKTDDDWMNVLIDDFD